MGVFVPLAGCVTKVAWPQRQALDSLVGQTPAQLVALIGPPTSTAQEGGATIMGYAYRRTELQPFEPGTPDNPSLTLGNHAELISHSCNTDFSVAAGHVTAWRITGSDCAEAPYPVLTDLKQRILSNDANSGIAANTPFPYTPRTGTSLVMSGTFQTQ